MQGKIFFNVGAAAEFIPFFCRLPLEKGNLAVYIHRKAPDRTSGNPQEEKMEEKKETAAPECRKSSDLRIFAIALLTSIIIVALYHVGSRLCRIFCPGEGCYPVRQYMLVPVMDEPPFCAPGIPGRGPVCGARGHGHGHGHGKAHFYGKRPGGKPGFPGKGPGLSGMRPTPNGPMPSAAPAEPAKAAPAR